MRSLPTGAPFQYDQHKGKDWQPMTNAELVKIIAASIARNLPRSVTIRWRED